MFMMESFVACCFVNGGLCSQTCKEKGCKLYCLSSSGPLRVSDIDQIDIDLFSLER